MADVKRIRGGMTRACVAALTIAQLWPSFSFAQSNPGPGGAVPPMAVQPSTALPGTTVSPLIVEGNFTAPGSGLGASDTKDCVGRNTYFDYVHGFALPERTDMQISAEVGYALAQDRLKNAAPADQAAARAHLFEAERRLADVQDALRNLPKGSPIRAIADQKSAERTHNDGVQEIYVPDEYKDLKLTHIVAAERQDKGATVLQITGNIENPRRRAISVPPLWFAALDKNGDTLKTQQAVATHQPKIPAGGSVPFNFELTSPPGGTERLAATFAPMNRLPLVLPMSMVC